MTQNLLNIQNDFQQYILTELVETEAMPITKVIAQQFGMNATDRLAIYHNAYRIRLRDALSEAYGKTHSYLGDDLFEDISTAYVQATPSKTCNLRWYGDCFPAHLVRTLHEHPVVAELAAFEWALGLAFDAADKPALKTEDIRPFTPEQWENLGFELQTSAQFLSLDWNAVAIWLALDQMEDPPDATKSEQTDQWLVWRKELQPHFRSLDQYEANALNGLSKGQSFSDVCEAAIASAGEIDITTKIAAWLQSWLRDGVLAELKFINAAKN